MLTRNVSKMTIRIVKWYRDKKRAYREAGWRITWWDRIFLAVVITAGILLDDTYPDHVILPVGISVALAYGLIRGFLKRRTLNRRGT